MSRISCNVELEFHSVFIDQSVVTMEVLVTMDILVVMEIFSVSVQILPSGKVKVIKIKRGPGRPRLHERVHQNGHVMNPAVNDKYRRKYVKLKKFARKMLFVSGCRGSRWSFLFTQGSA